MNEPLEQKPIRVLIVDDHPLMRDGTQTLLGQYPDIQIVGASALGNDGLRLVQELEPDVLILDLHLPDVSGVEVARQVRAKFPDVAVMVLTGYDYVGYGRALAQMGVQGYVLKTATGTEIVEALRTVARGGVVTAPYIPPRNVIDIADLTERELSVLQLLVAGHRNRDIADILSVSAKTVEFHMTHILEKLNVRSRGEAIGKAISLGLVAQPPSAAQNTPPPGNTS